MKDKCCYLFLIFSRCNCNIAYCIQILLINVIMDGPPALTLGMEPIDHDIKEQPPRDTRKHLISPALIRNCLVSAAVIICGTLWVFRFVVLD